MKTAKVIKYDPFHQCHHIQVDGQECLQMVDIQVSGSSSLKTFTPESLVGKRIKFAYTFPFISIAMDPELDEEKEVEKIGGDK